MNIYAIDEGSLGVRIEFDGARPPQSVGLGGWKRDTNDTGIWWTRIKGDDAQCVAYAMRNHGSFLKIGIENGRIISIVSDN